MSTAFDAYAIYQAAHQRLTAGKATDQDTLIVHLWSRIVQVNEQNTALLQDVARMQREASEAAFMAAGSVIGAAMQSSAAAVGSNTTAH